MMKKEKLIKQQKIVNEDYQKIKGLLIATIVVLVLIGGLFYINAKFVTKDLFQKDNTTTTEATYDKTLLTVNTMFKVNDKEYLVLAYDKNDQITKDTYNNLVLSYQADKVNLYSINLADQMNKKYYDLTKEQSLENNKINFNKATLLTIKDGKITSSITDMEKIIDKLSKKTN